MPSYSTADKPLKCQESLTQTQTVGDLNPQQQCCENLTICMILSVCQYNMYTSSSCCKQGTCTYTDCPIRQFTIRCYVNCLDLYYLAQRQTADCIFFASYRQDCQNHIMVPPRPTILHTPTLLSLGSGSRAKITRHN